jgi:DNA-binding CsgD family transcriptional regulator/PAS domain-containing protein
MRMRNSLSAEALSNLIGLIYDCALEPERWPETLAHLHNELDFANASMSLIALPSGNVLLNLLSGPDSAWMELSSQYGAEVLDQWGGVAKLLTYPLDEPVVLSRVRDRSEWENNRFYREWGRPQGIHDVMAIIVARDSTSLGSVAFGRHDSAGEIGELEVEAARLLIPHVRRAVAISRLLDAKSIAASTFESALDTFAVAVILTDVDLGIVHANRAAETMLSTGDPIRCERGALALRQSAVTAALGAAVRQAAVDEAGLGRRGLGIPAAGADGAPCVLHVLPLQHGTFRPGLMPRAVAAVFVAPAASPSLVPVDALAALFDLTAAEARIFAQIAAGRTKLETATALGIERTTVKTHLEHIFLKTGAGRQADLIKLATSLALPLLS